VAFAAKKAMISGQLRPGDPFPSVRVLSKAMKIHPNTAHKVIAQLTAEGLLEVRPGIGTVVLQPPAGRRNERARLLGREVEQLTVEAKKLGLTTNIGNSCSTPRRWNHERASYRTVIQNLSPRGCPPRTHAGSARRLRLRSGRS
jgi:GntR family transcriptional regulator